MPWFSARARDAIIELLEGTTSSIRAIASGTAGDGLFENQSPTQSQARAIHTYTHRFGVEFRQSSRHEQGPPSGSGSQRLASTRVRIPIVTKTKSTAQESERKTTFAAIEADAELMLEALMWPGNLTQNAAAEATNIIGGCLYDARWQMDSADWSRGLLRSSIEAECMISTTVTVPATGDPCGWLFNDTDCSAHIAFAF